MDNAVLSQPEASEGSNRLVKMFAMLLLPVLVAAVVACDNQAARGPYEAIPEGKPPNLGSTVPNPKEVVETRDAGQLPEFLSKLEGPARERVTAQYQGAMDHYDAYSHIPCYCGCAIYATPHQSLAQCYVKEKTADGQMAFTDHSLSCGLCQEAASLTIAGLGQNKALTDVRAEIFNKLKYTGIWTDTPAP